MTHEIEPSGEHAHGPEHDQSLPDAAEIPGDLTPQQSDADPIETDL